VLAAASLWATFGLFARNLYAAGFSALELATIRAWLGWLGIALVALPRIRRMRLRLRDVPFFALYGVAAFALFEVLFLLTLQRTSVAIAAALLYTAPAFVVLISAVLWQEHLPLRHWGALALVLVGVVLVTGAATAVLTGAVPLSATAVLTGLGAGFGYGLYTLVSKVAAQRYEDPIFSLFWMLAFAAIALSIVAPPFAAMRDAGDAWPALIGLGIFPTVLPYLLFLQALHWLRASTASMLASVEPVVAALLAALFLGEALDAPRLTGVALIAVAAGLLAYERGAGPGPVPPVA
jgi:drug/metabolite transporter (DMT)-like permease